MNEMAALQASQPQNINLDLTNLDHDYTYKKYIMDKSCRLDCVFAPCEEKEINDVTTYKETLVLEPYSVVLIMIDRKPIVSDVVEEMEQVSSVSPQEPIEEQADKDQEEGVVQE